MLETVLSALTGAITGSVLTAFISWVRLGAPMSKIQTRTDNLEKNFQTCRDEHSHCPANLAEQFDRSIKGALSGLELQMRDVVIRLGRIETHMMRGRDE